ncbi:MAG: tRNA-intron lyase [Nanoarchaeota archaeon]|nr:tRNA-intron lyase [Nanoarchaeota archaeon]
MIQAHYNGESVFSNSNEAFSLYEKSRLGEKIGGRIEYLHVEALFLIGERKMEVFYGKKKLGFNELIAKIKRKDKGVEGKLVVFSDLRKKGYIVKTALKFGAEFRVYERGVKPGEDHAKWIVYVVRENEQLKWHDFAGKNRIAHSTKKNLLVAIVDEERDISYYEVEWKKL